jgi:hypothetical protein
MDGAAGATAGLPDGPVVVEAPPIGVASIPAPTDFDRPPAPVPSAPVPSESPPPTLAGAPPAPSEPVMSEPVTGEVRTGLSGVQGVGHEESGFSAAVWAKLGCYVYLLVDPRTGRPFYVGQGRKDRCFRHVKAAREPVGQSGGDRHDPVLERIREVESGDRAVRIDILRHGLSRDEALLVEAATHEALGLSGAPTLESQRRTALEVNALLTKRAKVKRAHQLVLLRVGGTGTDASYEAVRHEWRIGRRWTDVDYPRSPRWAAIVAGDLVVGVYRIERWEPAPGGRPGAGPPSGAGGSRPLDRFSFVGSPDPELEKRYVGKSVEPYLGTGPRNPVTYVWCGPHWVNTPA